MDIKIKTEIITTISLSEEEVKEAIKLYLEKNKFSIDIKSDNIQFNHSSYGLFDGVTVKVIEVENS